MADISYSGYEQSGFNESSGTADLLAEKAKIPTTDAELKSQAESQYKDTLDILDSSLTRQITSMITSQATDEKLLTEAYNKSVGSMAAKLQKRGLLNGALPAAQTDALNKHMNEVKEVRAAIYKNQLELPKAHKDLLVTNYDKAIAQRIAANRKTNLPTVSELLQKVYELQSSSFSDYVNYLLNSSKKSSGGGRSYRRSSGSSSGSGVGSAGYASADDFKGDESGIRVDYLEGGRNRRLTNLDKTGTSARLYPNSPAAREYKEYVASKPKGKNLDRKLKDKIK